MSANLPRPSTDENISTTLSSAITDVAESMDVADGSKIVSPCYLVIDRVDSAGSAKATSLWEYVKVTNVTDNTLTITRAQGGSTGQAHSSGAVVEAVVTSTMFEDWYNVLNPEHTATGGHIIATATISTHLALGSASISGLGAGLFPTWKFTLPSLASTSLGAPAAMPRAGSLKFVSVTLSANISTATSFWDVNKNGTSVFDAIGRPNIAGGTFASTASIKTPGFNAGDVYAVDFDGIDLGSNNVDCVVTLAAY